MLEPAYVEQEGHREFARALRSFGEASGSSGRPEECCRGFEIVEVERTS